MSSCLILAMVCHYTVTLCFVDDDTESRRTVHDAGWGLWDRGSLEVT